MLFLGLVQTQAFAVEAPKEVTITELSEAEIAEIVAQAKAAATPEEAAKIAAEAAKANPGAAAQINAAVSAAVPSAAAQIAANQAQPAVKSVETAAGRSGNAKAAKAAQPKVSAAIPSATQGASVTSELQVANGFEDVSPQ